ncbi:MAG: helix-turn-helix transcriptional regulator, partial [Planctomycetota bacterium]|nr:helix-turn-helix transcriptional regulator [Planctomycetota bacterium]
PERVVHTIFLAFRCQLPVDLPLWAHDAEGRLRQIAVWLLRERDWRAPSADALRNAFISALVAEYARLCTAKPDALVEYIRGFIREHLDQRIALADLAAYAHMSKYHFLRRYRHLAGRTPMDEVRSLRLEFARDLLLTTHLPLKAIAARAGLGDPYHLSKLFRRYFNLRPSELRRFRPTKPEARAAL